MEQSIFASAPAVEITPVLIGAGWRVRANARIIDIIIHNIVGLVSGFFTMFAIDIYGAIIGKPIIQLLAKQESPFVGFLLAMIGAILYQATCEYIYGASLGKLLFKIHVVNENGEPISMIAALIRSFAFFIDSIFLGLIAYEFMKKSKLNQRLGDKWAKTIVVERSKLSKAQLPSGKKFVLAFIIAIIIDSMFASLSMVLKLI